MRPAQEKLMSSTSSFLNVRHMLQHCQTMLMHLKEKFQLNYDPIIFGPPKECLFEESQIRGVFFQIEVLME